MAKKSAVKNTSSKPGKNATTSSADHRKMAEEHHAKARLHSAKADLMDAKNPPKNRPRGPIY